MDLYNVVQVAIIILTTTTVIAQSYNVVKLSQNAFLDSNRLRYIYKIFFISNLIMVSTVLSLNLHRVNALNLLCSVPVFMITTHHLIKSYKVTEDTVDESTHLLLGSDPTATKPSPESTIPCIKILEATKIPIINSNIDSRDISPIPSLSNSKVTTPSIKLKSSSFSAPILAALMSSETVLAMTADSVVSDTSDPTKASNAFQLAIALIAIICFLNSQLVYSFSIFRTNLYTDPKKQMMIFAVTSLIAVLMFFNLGTKSFPLFELLPEALRYLFPCLLFIHSISCCVLQFVIHRSSEKLGFSRITVYDSIHSPLISA